MKSNEREARRRAESNANHDYDWHVYVSFAYRVLASQGRPIIADVPRERERERERGPSRNCLENYVRVRCCDRCGHSAAASEGSLSRQGAYLATDATSRDSIGIRYSKGRFKGAYIRAAYPELGSPERRGHRGCVARARRNIPFRAGHTNRSRYYGRKRAVLILTRPFGTCVSERDGAASRREQDRRGCAACLRNSGYAGRL